jgi:hypothetical protein
MQFFNSASICKYQIQRFQNFLSQIHNEDFQQDNQCMQNIQFHDLKLQIIDYEIIVIHVKS